MFSFEKYNLSMTDTATTNNIEHPLSTERDTQKQQKDTHAITVKENTTDENRTERDTSDGASVRSAVPPIKMNAVSSLSASAEVSPRNKDSMKFVIVGDSGVGKTCVLYRFSNQAFLSSYNTTIGIDF